MKSHKYKLWGPFCVFGTIGKSNVHVIILYIEPVKEQLLN